MPNSRQIREHAELVDASQLGRVVRDQEKDVLDAGAAPMLVGEALETAVAEHSLGVCGPDQLLGALQPGLMSAIDDRARDVGGRDPVQSADARASMLLRWTLMPARPLPAPVRLLTWLMGGG